MNYEIVFSIVFALILFSLVEHFTNHVAERIVKYKSNKQFKKLMARIEDSLPSTVTPSFNLEIGCDDDDCDICYDEPVAKKPVKRKPAKAQPVRRPVKKAVAKKKK